MWSDRRRLLLGLGGSLLLNVFLLGLVLGRGIDCYREHSTQPSGLPPIAASRYVEELPADQRAIFKDAATAHGMTVREARRRHRELRARVEDDIAAPTLDRAKVEADLAALHLSNRDIEDATSAVLLQALPNLTPEARAILAGRKPGASKP